MRRSDRSSPDLRTLLSGLQQRGPGSCWSPAADIYRTPTGWLVKVELAGVDESDVEVGRAGNTVVVRGHRRDTQLTEGQQHFSLEISYSTFERRIEVPCDLDHARLNVELRNGMLLIRVECEA